MDCAACGKPISATAKFCGKCGAPVKRPAKAPEPETATVAEAEAAHDHAAEHQHVHEHDHDHGHEDTSAQALAADIEGLVVTLTPPLPGLDGSQLLDLNLDLNLSQLTPEEPAAAPLAPEQSPSPSMAPVESDNSEWLQRLEQHQHELKKTLEKHSLLLDFISLASQQQSHQQSQPNPSEELLHNVVEQQTQFAVQLAQLQNHLSQAAPGAPARLPEELKLLLEKQKVEIQKSFSMGIAQTTDNMATTQQAEMAKVQDMLTANTLAAQAIEKNLTPLIQSVNDLKTKVQAVVKKVDDLPAAARKSSSHEDSADKGGGAMIFVIGMLCGLTVVLSSLAIYNFLSHDSKPAEHGAAAHEAPAHDSAADHGKSAEHAPAKEASH